LNPIPKSNREVYLDLAKIFAMLMMVLGHSFFELANPLYYNLNEFPWDWWTFARAKTAPMFLFLSGTVHVFANYKNEIGAIGNKLFRKRLLLAVILLMVGYLLNSPINTFSDIFNVNEFRLSKFYEVNILHIFGVGLSLLALLYRLGNIDFVFKSSLYLGIFSALISLLTINISFDQIPVFMANYLNYKNGSLFVLFPFISYLFWGTCFGILLKKGSQHNENSNRELNKFLNSPKKLLAGIILIILGVIVIKTITLASVNISLRSNPGVLIRNIGIIITLLFIFKQIKVRSALIKKITLILSARAIFIYVIHLFLIYGIGNFYGLKHYFGKSLTLTDAFVMSFVVILITLSTTFIVDYILKTSRLKFYLLIPLIVYWIYFFIN